MTIQKEYEQEDKMKNKLDGTPLCLLHSKNSTMSRIQTIHQCLIPEGDG